MIFERKRDLTAVKTGARIQPELGSARIKGGNVINAIGRARCIKVGAINMSSKGVETGAISDLSKTSRRGATVGQTGQTDKRTWRRCSTVKQLGGNASNGVAAAQIRLARFHTALNLHPEEMSAVIRHLFSLLILLFYICVFTSKRSAEGCFFLRIFFFFFENLDDF